jgi:hypothetical protein
LTQSERSDTWVRGEYGKVKPRVSPAVLRAFKRGDVTVIGVGQGHQSKREALPKQLTLAQTVHMLGRPHNVYDTVDPDGERGVAIVPRLQSPFMATSLGRKFGQRSVLQGTTELSTGETSPLTDFAVESVTPYKPEGFYTEIPQLGLYYKLVPVKAHMRQGRPVVGYATRKRVRRG